MTDKTFKQKVEEIVAEIPEGRVMTYGQIAVYAGSPRAARQVGQVAHYGNPELAWWRVVRKEGGMASGFPGGMRAQQKMLEDEGVEFRIEFIIQNVDDIVHVL